MDQKRDSGARPQRSRRVGVPLAKPRVALSAPSPRADYRTVGFPLQSLTRNFRHLLLFASILLVPKAAAQSDSALKYDLRNADPEAFVETEWDGYVYRADSSFFFKNIVWGTCRGGMNGSRCVKMLAEVRTMTQPIDSSGNYRFVPRGRGKKVFRGFLEYQLYKTEMFTVYRMTSMERLNSLYFHMSTTRVDHACRSTFYADPDHREKVYSYHHEGGL